MGRINITAESSQLQPAELIEECIIFYWTKYWSRIKSSGTGNGGRGNRMHPVGKRAVKFAKKEGKSENADVKGNATSVSELRKSFHIQFVRMHGIYFTRTRYCTF